MWALVAHSMALDRAHETLGWFGDPGAEEAPVPKVEMDLETTVAPDRVREALLDFSDRRPDIWPSLDRSFYEVHSVGETTAEIREGTKSPGMTVWARERYDW
jgi:hypothetical protein